MRQLLGHSDSARSLHLQDAFNPLPLRIFSLLIVQETVWITNQLHQPLGLCAAQDRILQVIAVFTEGLQTSFSYPLLQDEGRVSTVKLMSDSKPTPLLSVSERCMEHIKIIKALLVCSYA